MRIRINPTLNITAIFFEDIDFTFINRPPKKINISSSIDLETNNSSMYLNTIQKNCTFVLFKFIYFINLKRHGKPRRSAEH